MESPSAADRAAAARVVIEGYTDPWIDRTLGELGAVQALVVDASGLQLRLRLPVPTLDYREELEGVLASRLTERGIALPLRLELQSLIRPRACRSH